VTQWYPTRPMESASMLTRDGTRLDADIYRPDAEGELPVLLMRQPYGRKIASTVVYAHPTWYAAHGFIVVIQDVRGRGTSAGTFRLFEQEVTDGDDTVAWAANLPQSNGRVGMYGFSYQGMTQLFAAEAHPPALRAIAPAMVGYHPYGDWAYENDALLLQAGVGWAIQLAAETARLRGDRSAFQALYQASRQVPLYDATPAWPEVLATYAPDSFFHDWLEHPQPDEYWAAITPHLDQVDLPMLHVGGWFDPYLRGDLRLYQEMVARSRYPQPLWIGPWGHIPWGRRAGARDFGPAAHSPIDRVQIEWFNHWLRDEATDRFASLAVHLFQMGSNRWQSFTTWPPSTPQPWQLASQGLAAMHQDDGQLIPPRLDGERDRPNSSSMDTAIDTLVHDPWRPVPSLGGHAAIPAGVFDRAAIDDRSDVLTYTSAPLPRRLSITGSVEVSVRCRCDRPTFDLSLVLSEVWPDGAVYAITQGYGRFQQPSDDWQTCTLTLHPTSFLVASGHALRLSISAASFPAYAMNPGTGAIAKTSRVMDSAITTLSVQCHAPETRLSLPIIGDP
jgi:putative CocE/NonD family hydrolase